MKVIPWWYAVLYYVFLRPWMLLAKLWAWIRGDK